MTLLITGGAGFIGTAFLRHYDTAGDVVVVDNLHTQVHGHEISDPTFPPHVRFVRGDVRDPLMWDQLLSETRPNQVLHLAAETGTGQSLKHSSRHAGVNVLGSAEMLDGFSRNGVVPETIVLTSSRAVYGEGKWVTEAGQEFYASPRVEQQLSAQDWVPKGSGGETGSPIGQAAHSVDPRPSNVYAATKLAQEHVLNAWCASFGTSLRVLRLQNVYGAGQALGNPYTGVLTYFARQAVRKETIEVFEGGGILRDFVHVEDVVSAIMSSLFDVPPGTNFCLDIGSGTPISLLETARVIAGLAGAPEPVVTNSYRLGDVRAAFADISNATAQVRYAPTVGFAAGASDLLAWARE